MLAVGHRARRSDRRHFYLGLPRRGLRKQGRSAGMLVSEDAVLELEIK